MSYLHLAPADSSSKIYTVKDEFKWGNVRGWFVWLPWLSCFRGVAREYYGNASYDWHMPCASEYKNREIIRNKSNDTTSLIDMYRENKIYRIQSQCAMEIMLLRFQARSQNCESDY
jgi:hypothetical protein